MYIIRLTSVLCAPIIGLTLILFSAFFLSLIFYIEMNSASAIMTLMDDANTTLLRVDKNLTSSMISLALTQVNDSRFSGPDAKLDQSMAQGTISDLITGLSVISNHPKFNSPDADLCPEYPTDCMIKILNMF